MAFSSSHQEPTRPLLQADRRALNITLNSIGTELTRDDRRKLYSNFGLLYPHGHTELAGAEDFDQIRSAMEKCPPYQAIFNKVGPFHGPETMGAGDEGFGMLRSWVWIY